MDAAEEDDQLFTSFSHRDAFLALLATFLDSSPGRTDDVDDRLVRDLGAILDIYLPAPPLLDPHLHLILPPLVSTVRGLLVEALADPESLAAVSTIDDTSISFGGDAPDLSDRTKRLARLGKVIWWVLKVRGWKGCLSFFPPSLPSLPLLLSLFHPTPHATILPPTSWELRYILLVWLSLVSMIPFGLESAGGEGTIAKLDSIGRRAVWDGRGKEGEGGAVLLGRIYVRSDCSSLLADFLIASTPLLSPTSSARTNPSLKSSLLKTLAHLTPSASPEHLDLIRPWVLANLPLKSETSGLIRKLRLKVLGRCALRRLGSKGAGGLAGGVRRGRRALDGAAEGADVLLEENEVDVPEEVEEMVDDLIGALEDKDTIVRWSAAKCISRLSSHLPLAFADQIAEAVIAIFSRDVLPIPGSTTAVDLTAVKEGAWHGACLAVAELARRGVLTRERLDELVPWLLRAMTFDPRTSSHSTGTSVRDAACYVLWSLARAFTKEDMAPHALALARQSVALAVADREVSIRRAGSAAFQENVGRMGLFPHGIDVLVLTDFYAVSVRRVAFLSSAPAVAQHDVYRSFLLEHYSRTTLRHWDKEMRVLGAASLRALVEINRDETLGPNMVDQLIGDLGTMDSTWTHGILIALGQLAASYVATPSSPERDLRARIFASVTCVRPATFKSFSADQHLAAACQLIAHSATLSSLADPELEPVWRNIADLSLKSRAEETQEAVARLWASVSSVVDAGEDVNSTLLSQLKTFNTVLQQTIARVLGSINYSKTQGSDEAVRRLLDIVEPGGKDYVLDVEVRRNAFEAICSIVSRPEVRLLPAFDPPLFIRIFAALSRGLDDYTTDQRGDVGSWVRMAVIRGSTSLVRSILAEPEPQKWLNVQTYHGILSKVVKLAAERIDGVRKVAGEALGRLVAEKSAGGQWELPGRLLLEALFEEPEPVRWQEAASVFPRIVPLIGHPLLRRPVLEGLTLRIGSGSEGSTRIAARSFLAYLSSLPATSLSPNEASLLTIVRTLVDIATTNVTLNRVFIPVLDTLVLLFEDGDLARLNATASGKAAVRAVFATACKDLARIRNVQRVTSSMKIITGMISLPSCAVEATSRLPDLLNHRFPTVRSATAEQLYMVLQTVDFPNTDEIEDVLLSTNWTSDGTETEASEVVRLLLESVGGGT